MDYMEYVNRQIFGFETVEDYKEMIDLLIQLRTPKLSKDFKPSVINDILCDSLQPLSDEDLRPMSEAIENMDTMSMNLKRRQEGKQAAEKINRVLDKYNRLVLYEKAGNYQKNRKELDDLEQKEKEREICLRESEKRVLELEEQQNSLDAKKEAKEKERDSLAKSDAVALKDRELELADRIQEGEKTLQEKETQLQAKREQIIELEAKETEEQNREYRKEQELKNLLEEMKTEAETMAFEEHIFFEEEFAPAFKKPYSFEVHRQQFEKTQKGIAEGVSLLREADAGHRQVDELLEQRGKKQQECDSAQHQVTELETLMTEVQNEWKEAVYAWGGQNQEMVIPGEVLKQMAQYAQTYSEKSDFAKIRQLAADIWFNQSRELDGQIQDGEKQSAELAASYEELQQELEDWENHKEPEPVRSEAVIKNRERLTANKIPYIEFYKVLEFGGQLDKETCDHLEEALLQMGILDALLVEDEYREQVMKMDRGCCDRYLFVGRYRAEKSILDILDLNDSVNTIFLNQKITGILANIAFDNDGTTAVYADGRYQIGVLSGTITGEHEAGFSGTEARQRNRQEKIETCREGMQQIETELEQIKHEIKALSARKAQLQKEYDALPPDTDMRETYFMLLGAVRKANQQREELKELEEKIREKKTIVEEVQKQALQIAERLYLSCDYEIFQEADRAAADYGKYLYQLEFGHEVYLQIVSHLLEIGDRKEDLDNDLDQIRYDMGNTKRTLQKAQEEKRSIEEQLRLTDYDQIKEQLDKCIRWLKDYPDARGRCIEERAKVKSQIENLMLRAEREKEQLAECTRRDQHLQKCYEAERALQYVNFPEDMDLGAENVMNFLAVDCESLNKEDIIADLNRMYFENRGALNDYQLMQTEHFKELDEQAEVGAPAAKRHDIVARYQGVKIPFGKLLSHLEEDIRELEDLIRAGDRELFEDILANTVSRKIRAKINASNAWVEKMNTLMNSMNTSSGLKLNLRWRSKTAETEEQLDTKELVELLKKDYRLMRENEAARLSLHFRSKVEEARRHARESGGMVSFYQVMKETLDYRKWFEFQLYFQKSGERQKELTNSVFGTFSGGEKAMSMYVPLFSAVVAKYQGGRADAPRLISLDEAFAGVDNRNIRDMFRLMTEFDFDFIINSQVLWGDCDTLDALAIYQLLRSENVKFVTVMSYLWNGKAKEMLENERQMEQRAAELV